MKNLTIIVEKLCKSILRKKCRYIVDEIEGVFLFCEIMGAPSVARCERLGLGYLQPVANAIHRMNNIVIANRL